MVHRAHKEARVRPRVVYCDDSPDALKAFTDRHGRDFDVVTVNAIGDVHREIQALSHPPDLLLLDLYHPRFSKGDERAVAAAAQAQEKLDELNEKIAEVRECVDEAWVPTAIDVLLELRERYSPRRLPIMIYTRRGLLLLEDGDMRRISDAGAEWLLKDADRISEVTERSWIRGEIDRARIARRMARDLKIALWSVAASVVLGAVFGAVVTRMLSG